MRNNPTILFVKRLARKGNLSKEKLQVHEKSLNFYFFSFSSFFLGREEISVSDSRSVSNLTFSGRPGANLEFFCSFSLSFFPVFFLFFLLSLFLHRCEFLSFILCFISSFFIYSFLCLCLFFLCLFLSGSLSFFLFLPQNKHQ